MRSSLNRIHVTAKWAGPSFGRSDDQLCEDSDNLTQNVSNIDNPWCARGKEASAVDRTSSPHETRLVPASSWSLIPLSVFVSESHSNRDGVAPKT